MQKFTIFGPIDKGAVARTAIFREVVEGKVPDASYFGMDALFRGSAFVTSALTSHELRRRMRKSTPLRLLLTPARALALRGLRKVTLRRVGKPDSGRTHYFIFCPSTHTERISAEMLASLRAQCPGCRLVFYLIDSVERTAMANRQSPEEVLALLDCFDAAFTYDKSDVARYPGHMAFLEIPLWRAPAEPPAAPAFELYFCGRNKKRGELLLDVQRRLLDAGLRSHMRLAGAGAQAMECLPGMERCDWAPYEVTVSEILSANCILEVVAERNNESTLRYKEAVLYNKKLLTNNPNIANLPFYDPRWMRVFRTAGDIDLDWLRRVEPVDYGYRDEFSAQRFFRRMEELLPSD